MWRLPSPTMMPANLFPDVASTFVFFFNSGANVGFEGSPPPHSRCPAAKSTLRLEYTAALPSWAVRHPANAPAVPHTSRGGALYTHFLAVTLSDASLVYTRPGGWQHTHRRSPREMESDQPPP